MRLPIELPYTYLIKFGILVNLGFLLAVGIMLIVGTWLRLWPALPQQGRIVAVLTALFLFISVVGPHSYSRDTRLQIERHGMLLIDGIEDYRTTHGLYPRSLAAAGISVPQTPYGPIHYTLGCGWEPIDPLWYCLNVADSERYGFEMRWDNHLHHWWFISGKPPGLTASNGL